MPISRVRLKGVIIASAAGFALAVVGATAPASAADPAGAVTHTNLVSTQVGTNVTVDFDFDIVDPLAPGTITLEVDNFTSCSILDTDWFTVPVTASGHFHSVVPVATNQRSQVTLSQTDGTASQYSESNYPQDDASPVLITAAILPDSNPATGQVQLLTGNDRWTTHFQLEIDGVSTTAFPSLVPACTTTLVPYSLLGVGSTLTVVSTEIAPLVLATFVNPVPAAPPAPGGGGGSAAASLASTGSDVAPAALGGSLLLVVGAAVLLITVRRRRAAH